MQPVAAEPQAPALSEPRRLINVFIAPSKTFVDLKRKPSWWIAWLVTAVFSLMFAVVAVQKIDMNHFVQQQIDKSPRQQKQLEQFTPEQRAQNLAVRATITKFTFYFYPVLSLLSGLIIAAILMAVFNFVLGAEVSFPRALSVVFYAGLTGVVRAILLAVSLLTASDPSTIDITANPMPTNPGFFLDPQGNQVLYSLASALDVFAIWYVILLGIGFSLVSANKKPSTSTGITTMFVLYGIVVLVGLGFKLAFS